MEKEIKTYYVVEIGSADLFFSDLTKASEFFAKVVGSGAVNMSSVGYNHNFSYVEGSPKVSMKTEVVSVYQSRKAAEFAKSSEDKEE